jgi:integrase
MTGQMDLIDGYGLAEQAARPLTLAELAGAVKTEHSRSNTEVAFRQDWAAWCAFVAAAAREGLAVDRDRVDPDALVVFARWLALGGRMPDGSTRRPSSPATVRRRLTGVVAGWKAAGQVIPQGISSEARRWIKGHETQLIADRRPVGRGQAPALEVKHLRKLIEATDPRSLAGYRDRALLLLGFAIGARRSELAGLDVDDITEQAEGLDVHVRQSKTGHRHVPVIPGQNPATCPVRAWRAWQQASGIVSGAALRSVDRHDKVRGRLSGEAVGEIVTRAGERAGIPGLTGHSLRSGLATEARRAGHTVEQIADQGGWSRTSPALHGYIRNVDRWTDNVLAGIGL